MKELDTAPWREWYDCYETEGLDPEGTDLPIFVELAGKRSDRTNFKMSRRLQKGGVQRIAQVRAVCSEPLVAPVRHHLRHAVFCLSINEKPIIERPLIDLVLTPHAVGSIDIDSDFDIKGRVRVTRATPALKAYLNQQYAALEGMEALAREDGPRLAAAFKSCAMQVWIFFGGPGVAPVM